MLASVEFANPHGVADAAEDEDDVDEWTRAIPRKGPIARQPMNPSRSLYGGKHTLFKGARGPTGPSRTMDEDAEAKRASESTSRSEATTELGPACDDEKHLHIPSLMM